MAQKGEILGHLRWEDGRLVENTLPSDHPQTADILDAHEKAGTGAQRGTSVKMVYKVTDPPKGFQLIHEHLKEIRKIAEAHKQNKPRCS